MTVHRRTVLLALMSTALPGVQSAARANGFNVVVSKDPNCGCCVGWVEHLRASGFTVEVRDLSDLGPIKERLGVPHDLAACHTAEVGGYVIEGHVPASAIHRLLREKPPAKGLAVPGMPAGSPGMEVPGSPAEEYAVILFGPHRRTFARYKGATALRP